MKVLNQHLGDDFAIYHADCVDVVRALPDSSVDFSIFSPPFASLFTYSNSDRDMGNVKSHDVFWVGFKFLVQDLIRAMKPGRCVSIHCAPLAASKQSFGYIGVIDFRSQVVRAFQDAGFIFHSEVTVWKDPVVQMQRTKALGLLWKQIKKDSAMSRQGFADYVVTFRKPGDNPKPLSHTPDEFPVNLWQELASPVWDDIKQSNTLNRKLAREEEDERHICPLQLDLIERCLFLWSIPGDIVFSPFTGIGSEGYVATAMGRKFIGAELKKSYFDLAIKNIQDAPRAGYRFPRFSERVGDWVPGKTSPEPIAEFTDDCQLDFFSSDRIDTHEVRV